MTLDEIEKAGYHKLVMLSRHNGTLYYREETDAPAANAPERVGRMDRLGCVAAEVDGVWFDIPVRPLWLGSDGGV